MEPILVGDINFILSHTEGRESDKDLALNLAVEGLDGHPLPTNLRSSGPLYMENAFAEMGGGIQAGLPPGCQLAYIIKLCGQGYPPQLRPFRGPAIPTQIPSPRK